MGEPEGDALRCGRVGRLRPGRGARGDRSERCVVISSPDVRSAPRRCGCGRLSTILRVRRTSTSRPRVRCASSALSSGCVRARSRASDRSPVSSSTALRSLLLWSPLPGGGPSPAALHARALPHRHPARAERRTGSPARRAGRPGHRATPRRGRSAPARAWVPPCCCTRRERPLAAANANRYGEFHLEFEPAEDLRLWVVITDEDPIQIKLAGPASRAPSPDGPVRGV